MKNTQKDKKLCFIMPLLPRVIPLIKAQNNWRVKHSSFGCCTD